MENKGIKFLSVCLSIIFTVALIFFITGIIIEYKNAPSKTQTTLLNFVEETSKAAEYYLPGTDEFSNIMRARVVSNPNIAVVSIKQAGITVFAYPVSSEYITANKDGEPQISASSSLVSIKTLSKELAGKPSIITAAIYNLQPSVIYSYTRIAFLFILGGTLIAGIALLYLYLTDQSIKEVSYEDNLETEKEQNEFNSDAEISSNENKQVLDDIVQEVILEENINTYDIDENLTENEKTKEDSLEENIVSVEPSGLFSPITGFGWESYLENRLDSELVRSASTEEDLALLIIRIKDLDRTSETAHKIFEQFLDTFKYRDLIFEYKQDGFSCLLQNTNVDKAIEFAEQLYTKLSNTLKDANCNNQIGIGISSRSFRIIPGKRIFTEAEQALERSFTDEDTTIVAFKVDPSKYRQYIAESTQN